MIKEIESNKVTEVIKQACTDINFNVDPKLKQKLEEALNNEESPIAKSILENILLNFDCAQKNNIPICQDTGMVIVFAEIGQDVHITGGSFEKAVNEGVKQAYKDSFLRKSIVSDPIERKNTFNNTPAILHTRIVDGDKINFKIMAKGFGSENTSQLKMLKPADGINGIENFIKEVLEEAIPNACAPVIVGIGIGGDFETCALNAKKALTLPIDYKHKNKIYEDLSNRIIKFANNTGIGPMGLGGINSALKVNIIESPTHIAGLPVAINICCYADRITEREL